MEAQHIFGAITMVLAIGMVFKGLPDQIKKNRKDEKCGQPLSLAALAFGVYISRVGYALTIPAFWILLPDLAGATLSAIILWQWWKYRK